MLKNNGFHNRHSPILRAFSPASLFSSGAPGAWYDPSDYTTLFQDSAGTTPVTAVEQPVGLMLDKSKGLVLGSQLITPEANRDFSSDTGYWTKSAGATIGSGACTITGTGQISKTLLLTIGKTYNITYDLAVRGGSVYIATFFTSTNATTSGAKSFILTATSGTLTIVGNGGATDVDLDNISVKELPGNHAFQATSASRPVLSARYNLLTKTEDFGDAVWVKTSTVSINANVTTAPDGTSTADKLVGANITNSSHQAYQIGLTVASGVSYKWSAYFKAGEYSWGIVNAYDTVTSDRRCYFDLQNGVLGTMASGCTGTITSVGNGWYFCTVTKTTGSASGGLSVEFSNADNTASFVPSVGYGIYAWGASVVPSNQSTLPYQRVNTSTDYATTGFLPYLRFDGVDDSLSTNSISFTSTDKMSVFAGVRKLSDAAAGMITELSADASGNNGSFYLLYPRGSTVNNPSYLSRGTSGGVCGSTANNMPSPVSNVLAALSDISADSSTLRVNGAVQATQAADQGTGNYGNYPLYIGRRGGSSLPLNGQLYSLIIVGKAVTAGELTSTETYVNQKTGAYA